MTQTRLYSTQTHKNRVGFVSCLCVVPNFISPMYVCIYPLVPKLWGLILDTLLFYHHKMRRRIAYSEPNFLGVLLRKNPNYRQAGGQRAIFCFNGVCKKRVAVAIIYCPSLWLFSQFKRFLLLNVGYTVWFPFCPFWIHISVTFVEY